MLKKTMLKASLTRYKLITKISFYVGDYVGVVAGMGGDLFESFVGAIIG